MSKKYKKIRIKQNFERVLLSDVLPYETPVFFSNRYFYRFIKKEKNRLLDTGEINFDFAPLSIRSELEKIFKLKAPSIPFTFKIKHKSNEYRALSICHPAHQLEMAMFYKKFGDMILYYCNKSSFSLRKPKKIAKFTYFRDSIHDKKKSKSNERIELDTREYEQMKSYFAYASYGNVYKFYESSKFHEQEKKFDYLLKLDISKCFDSIYTHSIEWAALGKEETKHNLSNRINHNFSSKFDNLMQSLNYKETNGIVVGPEFSRIFSEIILQDIDVKLEKSLLAINFKMGVDYEIHRYVDDYFIFFNEPKLKDTISLELQTHLRIYKLNLNTAKEKLYTKPIITNETIARNKISQFFKSTIYINTEAKNNVGATGDDKTTDNQGNLILAYIKPFNATKVISKFKSIIHDSEVEYSAIMNYTLIALEKRLRYFAEVDSNPNLFKDRSYFQQLKSILEGVVEFSFFIYSVEPKVSYTIKLCSLTIKILNLVRQPHFIRVDRDEVYKLIFDNIVFVLRKFKAQKHIQLETLFLLQVMNELGSSYRANQAFLEEHFGTQYDAENNLDYFSITTLLQYIGNDLTYQNLHQLLLDEIIKKFLSSRRNGIQKLQETELFLLFTDVLYCPSIDIKFKKKLLPICGITNCYDEIIDFFISEKIHFTNWNMSNFSQELDRKRGREVY